MDDTLLKHYVAAAFERKLQLQTRRVRELNERAQVAHERAMVADACERLALDMPTGRGPLVLKLADIARHERQQADAAEANLRVYSRSIQTGDDDDQRSEIELLAQRAIALPPVDYDDDGADYDARADRAYAERAIARKGDTE